MRSEIKTSPARDRLLAAAARVFAREGLDGATTRAIAREARVNEVTLFRHFGTKDRLLAAVVGENFRPPEKAGATTAPATGDLRADLLAHAQRYDRLLDENLPLVRTMIGEIHRHHRSQERAVYHGVFRPLRESLVARLKVARARGELPPGGPVELLADLFGGMIFSGVLRRASQFIRPNYSANAYLQSAVDLFLRGAAR
ncbi:MAG TPA: TetR/AcrR family transcriptional regulator [Opitutaceae bacterium]|nr:TetR/AcrR family transcriptional regulator [Opitutaceae bacterium]